LTYRRSTLHVLCRVTEFGTRDVATSEILIRPFSKGWTHKAGGLVLGSVPHF